MDNITVKSSGNTIKLQSTPEEVTGGYFDSEEVWHEFGGGGDSIIVPRITVTFKNREGQESYGPSNDVIVNGVITSQEQDAFAENGEDVTYTTIVPYTRELGAILHVGEVNSTVVTEMVNCTTIVDDDNLSVIITNISEEASCTVTKS